MTDHATRRLQRLTAHRDAALSTAEKYRRKADLAHGAPTLNEYLTRLAREYDAYADYWQRAIDREITS